jgi:hypothetical protein
MKTYIISILGLILISGCCKPSKEIFSEAWVKIGEEDLCGFRVGVDGGYYAPINLPIKYQQVSSSPEGFPIFIQYRLLDVSDSLRCQDNLTGNWIAFRKMVITKILE